MKRIVVPSREPALPVTLRQDLRADGSEQSWSVLRCPTCAQLWPTETEVVEAPALVDPGDKAHRRVVRDLMQRRVACVSRDVSLDTLAWWLLGHGLTSAPVIDDQGRLIGFVSMSDLVRALFADDVEPPVGESGRGTLVRPREPGFHEIAVPRVTVADVMTPLAIAIGEHRSLAEAAAMMARGRVHQLAVVNTERRVVGLLSSLDLAQWLAANA